MVEFVPGKAVKFIIKQY